MKKRILILVFMAFAASNTYSQTQSIFHTSKNKGIETKAHADTVDVKQVVAKSQKACVEKILFRTSPQSIRPLTQKGMSVWYMIDRKERAAAKEGKSVVTMISTHYNPDGTRSVMRSLIIDGKKRTFYFPRCL